MEQADSRAPVDESPRDPISADLREKVLANHLVPLWESGTTAFSQAAERAFHWPWKEMEPVVREMATIIVPSILERRVMMMMNPTIPRNTSECCSGLISAGIQALMPGEVARPHRHSMHALRFVLEGEGAETIVEGKPCPMRPGDLVVTPGWTWHEHRNPQGTPTIWVDILDVAIHRALGTDAFQPGPPSDMADAIDDEAFAIAGFVPVSGSSLVEGRAGMHTPVFRYQAGDAAHAVSAAPVNAAGTRLVRYANPVDGTSVLPTIDCYLQQIDDGVTSREEKATASQVCVVVAGEGESKIGDVVLHWKAKDVFTVPRGAIVQHRCDKGPARIFIASDRVIYHRMGQLARDGIAMAV